MLIPSRLQLKTESIMSPRLVEVPNPQGFISGATACTPRPSRSQQAAALHRFACNNAAAQMQSRVLATEGEAAAEPRGKGPLKLRHAVGKGAQNERPDVIAVQNALRRHGYLRSSTFAKGTWDAASQRALDAFQKDQTYGRRLQDGKVDPGQTSSRLLAGRTLKRPRRTLNLTGKVGLGVSPHPSDVRAVQDRLVHHGYLNRGSFTPGQMDPRTQAAIEHFQLDQCRTKQPDGVITPGHRTSRRLQRARLRYPRSTFSPVVPGSKVGLNQITTPGPDRAPFSTRFRNHHRVKTARVIPRTDRLITGTPAKEMTAKQAYAELKRLGIPFKKVKGVGLSDGVQIKFPLLGVEMRPVLKGNRKGMATKLSRSRPREMDVRMAVALAHTIQHIKKQGAKTGKKLVAINDLGLYVTHRKNGTLRTGGSHPRGLALDIHSFTFQDKNGKRSDVSVPGHWRTARSKAKLHANSHVENQTAQERQNMSNNEKWLRQLWGFMETEFDLVITPSHNYAHRHHYHLHLRPTKRQARNQRASFRAYQNRNRP